MRVVSHLCRYSRRFDDIKECWVACFKLVRWHSPTGAFLLYAPCAWGLALAGSDDLFLYILFAIGAWFMRSAGCVLNDWADRKLDAMVPRTCGRPLACGRLSPVHALFLGLFCLVIGACVWWILPLEAKSWSLFGLLLACIYPWTKRFFIAPQLWLGITFNIGVMVAYVAVKGSWGVEALWLWASAAFWTVAYDTVYALHDAAFDKKLGYYSTAYWAEKYPYVFVGIFLVLHALCLVTLLPWVALAFYSVCLMGLLLSWDLDQPSSSRAFFNRNMVVASLLFFLLLCYG